MKQKLLLLSAVFFGVLAFILTFQQINSERRKIQATMQEVALLELKRDIAENEIITEDAILVKKYQRARSQLSNSREVTADQKNLIIGRKALFPINRGSVLQWNDLQTTMAAGREGANSVIRPGYKGYLNIIEQSHNSIIIDNARTYRALLQSIQSDGTIHRSRIYKYITQARGYGFGKCTLATRRETIYGNYNLFTRLTICTHYLGKILKNVDRMV